MFFSVCNYALDKRVFLVDLRGRPGGISAGGITEFSLRPGVLCGMRARKAFGTLVDCVLLWVLSLVTVVCGTGSDKGSRSCVISG